MKNNIKQGEIYPFGDYDWRVLEVHGGKALLLSENVLEERAYQDKPSCCITWENSTLRRYLNSEFYNKFNNVEKTKIAEIKLENKANPWYGTNGGNDTTDRIFLLSIEEVVMYFGDSGQLKNRASTKSHIEDQYNGARIAKDVAGEECWWWLRSPGFSSYNVACVSLYGSIDVIGNPMYSERSSVRPALWVEL